jgi:acetyl-CoA carboxylase biotin carboxylase subunit
MPEAAGTTTTVAPIRRIFVANRGEIAVRIVRACRAVGVEAVVGVSEADRGSMAAQLADRAVCIGASPAADSYLNRNAIVTAALGTGCDALHPGYGFLSERAGFQRLCAEHGLVFVGPSAEAIEAVGDKLAARRIAERIGVPTVPGTDHVKSAEDALAFGRKAGYPFLFKASAGGGGRGMRVVRAPDEVAGAFDSASAEAGTAFGDPTLFIERYIERARHVEIQIMADAHGNVVHLGERDCSTQRRHQKIIEEGPSPVIGEEQRARMGEAAVRLAREVGYRNAGTVEFIFDMDGGDFYFLEVNTRIQVEHPVTEMITGTDLVAEQIRVAAGAPLSFSQDGIRLQGHAIECRINAEDAARDFMPSPGRITAWTPPLGEGLRLDTHCTAGSFVPPYYDSMIAKLIAHGRDRAQAVERMAAALERFHVAGIQTTIPFHQGVMRHPDFLDNRVTTRWTEQTFIPQWDSGKTI